MIDIRSGIQCLGPCEAKREDPAGSFIFPMFARIIVSTPADSFAESGHTYSFSNAAEGMDERYSLQKIVLELDSGQRLY